MVRRSWGGGKGEETRGSAGQGSGRLSPSASSPSSNALLRSRPGCIEAPPCLGPGLSPFLAPLKVRYRTGGGTPPLLCGGVVQVAGFQPGTKHQAENFRPPPKICRIAIRGSFGKKNSKFLKNFWCEVRGRKSWTIRGGQVTPPQGRLGRVVCPFLQYRKGGGGRG